MNDAGREPGAGRGVPLIPDDEGIFVQSCAGGARLQAREGGEAGFDFSKKKIFLEHLRRTANVTRSAKAAGIGANTAYRHRQRYPHFDLAWADALVHAIDVLETTMLERALRYNVSLSEDAEEKGDATGGEAGKVEPFSNGDAMRLIKLHRESLAQRRIEIAARLRERPEAVQERLLEKFNTIYDRVVKREQVLNDAPL